MKSKIINRNHFEIALLDCSQHHFPKHFHNEYIIGANVIGGEEIWIDGKNKEAGLDDITLYNPGEVQSSRPLDDQWTFTSLYIDPTYIRNIFGRDEAPVFDTSVIRCGPQASALRTGLLAALSGTVPIDELEEFVLLLAHAFLRGPGKGSAPSENVVCSLTIRRVEERLMNVAWENLSISQIADESGLTPVQLVRMFKNQHGMPPAQWRRVHQLHRAKQALRSQMTLVDIAQSYGFSDQAHLTREFKKLFAITPGAYRRAMK